jgi:hypothetical protein
MGDITIKADRGAKAFSKAAVGQTGEISDGNCNAAGLHDNDIWGRVQNITRWPSPQPSLRPWNSIQA